MAIPVTAMAGKIALAILNNDKLRKTTGWIVAAIISPLILIIVLICGILTGTSEHNNMAVELCFEGGVISDDIPEDYRGYIEDMRASFALLDGSIAKINNEMEEGSSLDAVKVKSAFYALFFGDDSPSRKDHRRFVECFVAYEERVQFIENGGDTNSKEVYTVKIPIRKLSIVYGNINSAMGVSVTQENQINASEIYYRVLYGRPAPTYGDEFDKWSDGLSLSDAPFIGVDGFCSPLGESWRSMVTSEFGYRKDPFTGKSDGHSGLDMGAGKGTPIRVALSGTVYIVRHSNSGYGYHVMVDHGGGFVTLYAHCSKILVSEGQQVEAGTIIAQVGTTGRSTGNHLHFEVRINGVKQNPRSYLP